jgi:hypothetical protein
MGSYKIKDQSKKKKSCGSSSFHALATVVERATYLYLVFSKAFNYKTSQIICPVALSVIDFFFFSPGNRSFHTLAHVHHARAARAIMTAREMYSCLKNGLL